MLTVGLLAVVVYLYTVVAFNFFRKFYNKSEDEDEPDMKCDDMMTVRLTSVCLEQRKGMKLENNFTLFVAERDSSGFYSEPMTIKSYWP